MLDADLIRDLETLSLEIHAGVRQITEKMLRYDALVGELRLRTVDAEVQLGVIRSFDHFTRTLGYVPEPTLTDEQAEQLRAKWLREHGQCGTARILEVLPDGPHSTHHELFPVAS